MRLAGGVAAGGSGDAVGRVYRETQLGKAVGSVGVQRQLAYLVGPHVGNVEHHLRRVAKGRYCYILAFDAQFADGAAAQRDVVHIEFVSLRSGLEAEGGMAVVGRRGEQHMECLPCIGHVQLYACCLGVGVGRVGIGGEPHGQACAGDGVFIVALCAETNHNRSMAFG